MQRLRYFGVAGLALVAAPAAWAQQGPGWNISWGLQAVPLSPVLNVLLALMLGGAAYWFMRKRGRGQALMGLMAVTAGSALLLPTDMQANGYDYYINTPTGTQFLTCNGNSLDISTTVQSGVVLSTVTPTFSSQLVTNSIQNQCAVGFRVTPQQSCQMPCPQSNG